jgi:hypothetical protein
MRVFSFLIWEVLVEKTGDDPEKRRFAYPQRGVSASVDAEAVAVVDGLRSGFSRGVARFAAAELLRAGIHGEPIGRIHAQLVSAGGVFLSTGLGDRVLLHPTLDCT